MKDSMGNLPVARSTELLDLRTKPAKPKTFGKAEAFELVGRLVQHWPYMAAEQGSEKVLAREYELQFKGYDPEIVDAAATAVIGEPGRAFGPKPGELVAAVKMEFRRRHAPKERPAWREPESWPARCANTPEEVMRRAAQCLTWRKQYGLDKIDVEANVEPDHAWSLDRDAEDFRRKHAAAQALVEG